MSEQQPEIRFYVAKKSRGVLPYQDKYLDTLEQALLFIEGHYNSVGYNIFLTYNGVIFKMLGNEDHQRATLPMENTGE